MDEVYNIKNAEHYIWGDNCEGWHLVKTDTLSVIKERMPSRSKEQSHYHVKAQQYFYILDGIATFEIDSKVYIIEKNKGILIKPGIIHRISNKSDCDLEFIVISEPKSHGDRVNM